MTETKDPLEGKYFHFQKKDLEGKTWHGQVLARVGDSYFLQLLPGHNQTLVPIAEMNYWFFYDSYQELQYLWPAFAF